MARDRGLEELVRTDLGDRPGLTEKPMFGGLAFMLDGHLLCAASDRGTMMRLGKGQDGWALQHQDVSPMVMQDREMPGWVRAGHDASADDELRQRLLTAAVAFVATLPPKA